MNKNLKYFLPLLLLLVCSCDKALFKQFDDDFTDNRWMRTDVRHYDFTIPEAGNYDLEINFRHVYGLQFAQIPMKVTIVSPDKVAVSEDITMQLVDAEGHSLSDCAGDVCDKTYLLLDDEKLEPGDYKLSLSNEFDHEFLPNVMGVGIRVVASGK